MTALFVILKPMHFPATNICFSLYRVIILTVAYAYINSFHNADFRYNACWLPLLAKHSESQITKGPLVIPLDCEWIWHCHRLNPVGFWTKT